MNTRKTLAKLLLLVVGFGIFAPQVMGRSPTEGVVMSAREVSLLIVASSGDSVEFLVPPSARIIRNGEVAPLQAIQPGDRVIVSTQGGPEDMIAKDIVAVSPL